MLLGSRDNKTWTSIDMKVDTLPIPNADVWVQSSERTVATDTRVATVTMMSSDDDVFPELYSTSESKQNDDTTLKLRPGYASVVVLFKSLWDAITDPGVGILVDRFDSRFGKIKPWLVISTPFAMVSYFLLWCVPDIGDVGKLVYYLFFMCSVQTCLTCFHLPYAAMTMYLSNDQADRDSATAYRMTCEMLGIMLGVIIQAQFMTIGMNQKNSVNPCAALNDVIPDNMTSIMDYGNSTFTPTRFESTLSPATEDKDPMKLAFIFAALTVDVVFLICCIVVTLGTKEKQDDAVKNIPGEHNFFKDLKTVLSHGPYVKLLMCFMCALLALQGAACFSIPVWQMVSTRFGKKTTLAITLGTQIPLYASFSLLPGTPFVIFPVCVLFGLGAAVMILLPWSMIPDVIDDFTIKTGMRKEGLFYSFYVFFTKFAVGMALGMSTLALEFTGYEAGACVQPRAVGVTLRVLVSAPPTVFLVLGLFCLWRYPITEKSRAETRSQLQKIRERNRSTQSQTPMLDEEKLSVGDDNEYSFYLFRQSYYSNGSVEVLSSL
uniref:Major facilitator superfamily domain-containing protein 2A-like n=1 Tax=Saccoglossus kowalevskii TaxID=10224 RepID=A0ABM0MJN0_SACKO|nr:PREDICTED: major facilitator superfamily domain-containing protein 2A-like [Saccoglossus kowalevskii]